MLAGDLQWDAARSLDLQPDLLGVPANQAQGSLGIALVEVDAEAMGLEGR